MFFELGFFFNTFKQHHLSYTNDIKCISTIKNNHNDHNKVIIFFVIVKRFKFYYV